LRFACSHFNTSLTVTTRFSKNHVNICTISTLAIYKVYCIAVTELLTVTLGLCGVFVINVFLYLFSEYHILHSSNINHSGMWHSGKPYMHTQFHRNYIAKTEYPTFTKHSKHDNVYQLDAYKSLYYFQRTLNN
jgi:hypothetical protein